VGSNPYDLTKPLFSRDKVSFASFSSEKTLEQPFFALVRSTFETVLMCGGWGPHPTLPVKKHTKYA